METKTRYSDEELEMFKALILEKLDAAKKLYADLKEDLCTTDGNDPVNTVTSFKAIEDGAATFSREFNGLLAQKEMVHIKSLEAALVRIENKTYGICRKTGKLIPKERLMVVPHATLCVEAKLEENK